MSARDQLLQWALCLAELGWKVFPLNPGSKVPALHGHRSCPRTGVCENGHRKPEQRASGDPDRIRRCWSTRPYNIGLATWPSGLVVVDLDLPKLVGVQGGRGIGGGQSGAEVFATRARREGSVVPATYTVATPSGGTHLYFRAPAGVELRSTQGELGPLIDTRARTGYVVAPGSITPEGAYELYDDTEPADLPGWLVQALASKPSTAISAPREIAAAKPSAYVSAALRDEAERVATAKPGRQNDALYCAALALGRLVAGGAVSDAQVRAVLHQAMSRLSDVRPHDPWTPAAIDATISSGFRVSAHRPRYLGTRAGRGVAV
ncbi:bifunctional DNA primase/polymerase [Saccharopolyspora sp. NPDC050389]|uniref:bifunctional DNA primase/polymerase n=1 Tax=Saccharopolyspora sp. NPDC050389 TaxID=3155516 RepID=UPI0034043EB3